MEDRTMNYRITGILAVLLAVALAAGFSACSSGGSSSGGGGSDTLFNAVKSTTPAITPSVATSGTPTALQPPVAAAKAFAAIYSATTITDQVMNTAFQLLRDYSYPADEGVVDMTNIYKVLWEAGRYLDEAPTMCTAIASTADNAVSPFAFADFLGHTYDCGGTRAESGGYGSSVAYKATGADKYMLASYKWAPDATQQIAIGAIQAHYNDTTKDVELIFAQTVNYPANSSMGGPAGGGFASRTRIIGNASTHTFELKITVAGSSGFSTALVGKGVSQGTGNYFLLRSGTQYYCLPADATEADVASAASTGAGTVDANCAAYEPDVTALVPYDAVTDVPAIDLSSFNDGVGGTPYKYLMF